MTRYHSDDTHGPMPGVWPVRHVLETLRSHFPTWPRRVCWGFLRSIHIHDVWKILNFNFGWGGCGWDVQNNTMTGHTTTYYTTQKGTQIMHLKCCHLKRIVFFSTLLKFRASNCLFYGDVLPENYSNCWSPFKQTGNLMPMSSVCFRCHEPWVICSSNSNNKHNKHRQDKEAKTHTKKKKLFQRCQPEISLPSIHGYGNDSTTI